MLLLTLGEGGVLGSRRGMEMPEMLEERRDWHQGREKSGWYLEVMLVVWRAELLMMVAMVRMLLEMIETGKIL